MSQFHVRPAPTIPPPVLAWPTVPDPPSSPPVVVCTAPVIDPETYTSPPLTVVPPV